MKLRIPSRPTGRPRRGAALLLSVLVLLVLVAIVFQLNITTGTDAQVARNDIGLTMMDLAIESQMLEEFEKLKADAEADSAGGEQGAAGLPGGGEEPPAGDDAGGAPSGPVDSREDDWARVQETRINDVSITILIQDEDSKYNILNMLHPDEELAREAYERVVTILDLCREDTRHDIDGAEADEMARAMRDHMLEREQSLLPRAPLLTDLEQDRREMGFPLSLREFVVLEPFDESHFRDFYDEDRTVVHSLGAYLTIWTAPMTAQEYQTAQQSAAAGGTGAPASGTGAAPTSTATTAGQAAPEQGAEPAPDGGGAGSGQGTGGPATGSGAGGTGGGTGAGYAVNVNTAPAAVLKGLMDPRDVDMRFWDEVIRYRNLVDEDAKEADQDEQDSEYYRVYGDEYEEPRQFFDDLGELEEVEGYDRLLPEVQQKMGQLLTVQSHVFTIYLTARRSTSGEELSGGMIGDSEEDERMTGRSLVRTVRCVVWRRGEGSEVQIVPLMRWEVVDFVPFEVEDFPEDRR